MNTQSGVEDFSQNTMPAKKRSRSSSKPRQTITSKAKTKDTKAIWPYASKGMGPMWDPFPAQSQAIMRYSTTIVLDPGLGVPAPYLFRANSIFDPDYTGIGHQPYGHDTYATIYNHYSVAKSTITMTPTSTQNGIYGISITDDVSVQADFDTIRETKGTKMAVNTGQKQAPVVQSYIDKQNFSKTVSQPTSALFGASPSEAMYFHCWNEGMNSGNDPQSTSFLITISYVVNMWELKDLGQS